MVRTRWGLGRSLLVALGVVTLPAATGLGCGFAGGSDAEGRGPGSVFPDPAGQTSQALRAQLKPMRDCDEAEAFARQSAIRSMNKALDANLKSLDEQELRAIEYGEKNGFRNGYGCYAYGGYGVDDAQASNAGAAGGGGSTGGAAPPPSSAERAGEASGTNNQVAGVDEADFLKNDGKYLYAVTHGALRIVDAWPAAQAHEVSVTALPGTPKKLFVNGDRALVYVSVPRSTGSSSGSSGAYVGYGGGECTYGYDCDFSGDGTATKILVFDIANRAAPAKVREVDLSGSLIAARRVGSGVHTVVATPPIAFRGVETWPTIPSGCDGEGREAIQSYYAKLRKAYGKLRLKNALTIATTPIRDLFPSIKEGGQELIATCNGYYRSSATDGASFATVLSVDMVNDGPIVSATVVSKAGAVYASASGLYMAVPHKNENGGWYYGMEAEPEASTIHRFSIGENPLFTAYEASGIVKGHVLNQFAMDEHDGRLRIATTSGHVPDPAVHSTVAILEKSGDALNQVGAVDHIAPTEDIRSVRFDGDRGFIVTFKKTDPLFVLDLATPTAPAILGELKIPGFSTYMHMMDPTHLLTIGYDADDHGSFAYFDGVLLQIFDVTNPSNPTLAHKQVIGTRGSSSEALTNHLAFTYMPSKHLLAVPMTICEGGGDGSYGTNMTFSGLLVYDVTTGTGFSERGRVSHPPKSGNGQYNNAACSNWWTNASSEVRRSVIFDDVIFSVSDEVIKASSLNALTTPLATVSLGP